MIKHIDTQKNNDNKVTFNNSKTKTIMKNDFVYYVAEISDEKLQTVKTLFKYAVVYDQAIIGFTNDEDFNGEIEGRKGKVTLVSSAEVSELPYLPNIILANVRDAELPKLIELFTYTILGWDDTDEDEGETIIGFTDSTVIHHTIIWDFDYFELVDNVSGKRQVPTIKDDSPYNDVN